MNESGLATHASCDPLDQVLEGENFGADSIEYQIVYLPAGIYSQVRDIFDEDWLNLIFPRPGNREKWKVARKPGDVVDEDVFYAEDGRGPKDRIGYAGFNDRSLYLSFA